MISKASSVNVVNKIENVINGNFEKNGKYH